jgi:DNA-binding beta-propeller fold protein YncE
MRYIALLAGAILSSSIFTLPARADDAVPLTLEAKIPLGAVSGRIDHMAIDLARQRLFVAELGNDSLGVVDLAAGKLLRRITGLDEPQGVGYEATTDTLYVANAGDGSVRLFAGDTLLPSGRIALGADADNVRVDTTGQIVIGHSSGALAVIDAASRRKLADIPLAAHPEGFQIGSSQIFVNVPDARAIAVIDRATQQQVGNYVVPQARGNFPMALDRDTNRVIVILRGPPLLVVLDARDGKIIARLPVCGDADDVFTDPKRRQIYVSCGEGIVAIFGMDDPIAARGQVKTASGARTSLFVPEHDRFYLATRASSGEGAAIWVFRPLP